MAEQDALGDALSRANEAAQVFAVVDAAHFEYLQDTLAAERFNFDALYLDEVENPGIASGPHLVRVTGLSQIAKLRKLIGDLPACVWWLWPDVITADAAIHRHLRGLNMVELPYDRFDSDTPQDRYGYEAVLFRHADPNTIAMLLPLLDEDQISRLFGGAQAILVDAPDVCSVRLFKRPEMLPAASRGFLRIKGGAQYQAIADGYTDILRNRAVREFSTRFDAPTEADHLRIESAFDRADDYKLDTKDYIWEFIDLDLKHGAVFELAETQTDLGAKLASDDLNGFEKLRAIKSLLALKEQA